MKRILIFALLLALSQPSCVVAGGYSSGDGWFFWPGGLGLLLMIIVALLFFRRTGRK